MRLQIELTPAATTELIRRSVAEWRPVDMQAEVLLREALGLSRQRDISEDRGKPRLREEERA